MDFGKVIVIMILVGTTILIPSKAPFQLNISPTSLHRFEIPFSNQKITSDSRYIW